MPWGSGSTSSTRWRRIGEGTGSTAWSSAATRRSPEFFQVKCSSRAEFNKYMRHRGFEQRTGIGGVMLSEDELRRAEAWAKERYDAD